MLVGMFAAITFSSRLVYIIYSISQITMSTQILNHTSLSLSATSSLSNTVILNP
jgi:hypothetical protein